MATIPTINISTPDDGLGTPIRGSFDISNLADAAINAELVALLTAAGIASGEVDLGAFAGTLIADGLTAKGAIQAIETAIEGNSVLSAGFAANTTGAPIAGDTLETSDAKLLHLLNLLNEADRRAGTLDASAGLFPATGNAGAVAGEAVEAGYMFIVTVAGVVDGVNLTVGDRLLALVDGADTATYAGNWLKFDSGIDFGITAAVKATDQVGTQGASGLAIHDDHAHPFDDIMKLVTATGTETLPPATGSGQKHVFVLDNSGPVMTLAPTGGESIGGVPDGTRVFNEAGLIVTAVDAAPGDWATTLNIAPPGDNSRTGEIIMGYADAARGWHAIIPSTFDDLGLALYLATNPYSGITAVGSTVTITNDARGEYPGVGGAKGLANNPGGYVPSAVKSHFHNTANTSPIGGGFNVAGSAGVSGTDYQNNSQSPATANIFPSSNTGGSYARPETFIVPALIIVGTEPVRAGTRATNVAGAGQSLVGNADGTATWV